MQTLRGEIIELLETFEDLTKFFTKKPKSFPESFAMPSSFEYKAVIGTVTHKGNGVKIFNGAQSAIFDAENNRVKIHRANKIFREPDTEV
jgi:hypothetical protein